jgi:hypothetical protein
MSDAVRIVEVGPRDGLQNEKALISGLIGRAPVSRVASALNAKGRVAGT